MAESIPGPAPFHEEEGEGFILRTYPPRATQDETQFITVVDHTRQNDYILPWRMGKEWQPFASFVKSMYERRWSEGLKSAVEDGRFEVVKDSSNVIVMPSVWSAVVRPGDRVRIRFLDEDAEPYSRRRRERDSNAGSENMESSPWRRRASTSRDREGELPFPSRSQESFDDEVPERYVPERERVRFRRLISSRQISPPGRRRSIYGSHDEIDVDNHDMDGTTDNSDEEDSEPPPPPEPIRRVVPAVDAEGKILSFKVDLQHGLPSIPKLEQEAGGKTLANAPTGRDMNSESLKITKAVNVETDGRAMIQIFTLPGPESSTLSSSIGLRWYHVHADVLDWTQFKVTCSRVTGIPERLEKVVRGTLHKVEKEKIKTFMGGMFVEPGTVLRGDDPDDPEAQSVVFSCIPYFDIKKQPSNSSSRNDHLHPARTLIQSYYPYEPVRERDQEQAYKRFGNGPKGNLIYVPSLWMMNIGPSTVVTCGYRPISNEFVESIKVVPEDLKQLSASDKDNKVTTIRLTDWDDRVLLYSLDECRTYFEMERKMQELNNPFGNRPCDNVGLELFYKTKKGLKKVIPASWLCIVSQQNLIFIDLLVKPKSSASKVHSEVEPDDCHPSQPLLFTKNLVPPFLQWPEATVGKETSESPGFIPADIKRSIRHLEMIEKVMNNEDSDITYRSPEMLAEDAMEEVKTLTLLRQRRAPSLGSTSRYYHRFLVETQRSKLTSKVEEFANVVNKTLRLFVSDIDKSTLLRKVWGAVADAGKNIRYLSNMEACERDPKEYSDPEWKPPLTGVRKWQIRYPKETMALPNPLAEDSLVRSITKCRRCKRGGDFSDPNKALEHLRTKHADIPQGTSRFTTTKKIEELKDWIRNEDQRYVETAIAANLKILDQTVEAANWFYNQLKDFSNGVRDSTGGLAVLYTLPRKLVETLRRLIVYYAYVGEAFRKLQQAGGGYQVTDGPRGPLIFAYTAMSLEYSENLDRKRRNVETCLLLVRENLCDMARSPTQVELAKRISLSTEYICSWLMRRLIVKPLDRGMTISDMYREYLSTLQFQVNHRPNKRLLRSIKLLQEEITILSEINSWQTQLISNYITVLDPATYPTDRPSRRSMFPYERLILSSCLDNLLITNEEYTDQFQRYRPLSESTKQNAEINEEDHGKAILVFTVVTIIFLPLSFVTSYLGMNTSDIRDMDNKQSLFWEIAIPLTVVVMGTILMIAYNGDELHDRIVDSYRFLTGKQDQSRSARGISVAQRKGGAKTPSDSASSTSDFKSIAHEAEYTLPKLDYHQFKDIYTGEDDTYPSFRSRVETVVPMQSRLAIPTTTFTDEYPKYKRRPENFPSEAPHRDRFWLKNTYETPLVRPTVSYSYNPTYRHQPPRHTYSTNPFTPPVPVYLSTSSPAAAAVPINPPRIKVHRKHIYPETLAHYALPWEPDPDNQDYIIIKQSLDKNEMDVLFEHTRRLRAMDETSKRGAKASSNREVYRERVVRRGRDTDDEWDM